MYKLPYFFEPDREKIIAFMQEYPFAIVSANNGQYPVATHLPLLVTVTGEEITLSGHLMKNTDHHKAFLENPNVLVIFNGPHCHVSASWYTPPQQASTWNYLTVHAKGTIQFHGNEETIAAVSAITDKYEGTVGPSSFEKLPKDYVAKLVKAISAFTIEVKNIDNVFKLSQNHPVETRNNIIAHLMESGHEQERMIATEMQQRILHIQQTK